MICPPQPSKKLAITSQIFWLFRQLVRVVGIIVLYCLFADIARCSMNLKPGEAVLQTDKVVGREVSPDQSWVALVNHRFRIEDLFFAITTTDTVWLVKASNEEQFRHILSQEYDEDKGIVIRHSRTNRLEDRPLIHWLSVGQLEVTAPINTGGSYIVLSRQTYDGLTVTFSFEESPEMQQRRHNLTRM